MKQHDNSEAMRLADAITDYSRRGFETEGQAKLRRMTAQKEAAALLRKQSERIAELEAERDEHQATATALIALLADIRKACGDNGTRMQPELVEFIGAMSTERDRLREEVERTSNNRDMWKGQCERQAEQLAQIRLQQGIARTTHKDTP